jgi:hypothetical protein
LARRHLTVLRLVAQVFVIAVDQAWLALKSNPVLDEAKTFESAPPSGLASVVSIFDAFFTEKYLNAWGQVLLPPGLAA